MEKFILRKTQQPLNAHDEFMTQTHLEMFQSKKIIDFIQFLQDTQNEGSRARQSQREQAGEDLLGRVMTATKKHVKNKVFFSSNASKWPASENPLRHRVR